MLATAVYRLLCLLCIAQCTYAALLPQNTTAQQQSQTIKNHPFPKFIDVTTEDLQYGLEQNLFTSQDLVKAYLARIMEVNGTLHAVTEVNPDALDDAKELDRERKKGMVRGPLHGLPVLVKGSKYHPLDRFFVLSHPC